MFAAEVEITITDAICGQRLSLQETKQLIFKNLRIGEQPNVADVKLVETYYIKVLLECARMEVEQCFDDCCKNKHFVNNFARHSDKITTITDIKLMCTPKYYVTQLELYSTLIDEYDLTSFITNLKADLWRKILEAANDGFKELEMLQYLTVCFQMNMISPDVREKLVEFNNGLSAQSYSGQYLRVLMETIPIVEKNTSRQLQNFLRSVKCLQSNYLFLETQLLSLINFYLKPIEISIKNLGNGSVVEIIGGIICMSKIVPKIEQILQDEGREKRIDEVRFIALYMLDIDYDFKNSHWHGFNIFVMAAKVNVSKKCEWNLSGVSSQKKYEKASSGSSCGNDGQDGKDGYSGESSGNVMILAEEMQNAQNFTVTLNGGHGSGGQDGGDGANGQDGTGITMSELKKEYPSPIHFLSSVKLFPNQDVVTLFNKISSKGNTEICWHKHPNRYIEVKLHNGQKIIYSLSRYGDFQCYLLYKGSKGEQGGRGGLNGLSGDGGFRGECLVVSKENKPFPVYVKSVKGSKGQNAKPGRTGEYGKNGWDIGYTDYFYRTQVNEFGTGHNQRLAMNYSTSSSGRVYCGYRYDKLGSSACYATIKASILDDRKLTDSEKLRETRKEGQRRKEAVATRKNVMLQKAMEKTYGKYFETGDCLMNTVAEMGAETMMNFNMMHRKAKQAFEEVESLKERSREKVSRYRIYEVTKKAKAVPKQNVKINSAGRTKQKLDIIENIQKNPNDANVWIKLCDEEFSIDELEKLERHFNRYQTQRQIETAEDAWIPRKFGLARFGGIINDTYQLEINQNMSLNNDFNGEKYLKISEQSYSDLEWLREFQDETFQNRNIKDTFHDLRQYQLSVSDLNIVETNYNKLVSIKMDTVTLEEFLNSWQTDDNQSFTKLSALKANKSEWGKVLEVFHCFGKNNLKSEVLKNNVPLYDEKELKKENNLLKYLFDLWNSLYTLKITNSTLAKMIEWLIAENVNCRNPPFQIQEYLKLEKNFMDAKSNSLNNLLLAIQCLSHRLPKASWQYSHEYPSFFLPKKTQNISKDMQHIDNKLLEKLYNIYTNKQNETIEWHKKIDKILLDICLEQMLSNKTISYAPLLELIAWKYGLNIRTYQKTNYGQFVCNREHYVCGKQIVHILISDDQTIENLVVDREFVKLDLARQNLVSEFQSKILDKNYLLPDKKEYTNDELVIYNLCQYFNKDDRDELETRLEKLSTKFIKTNSILLYLLHSFRCNGCHLQSNEMMVFVNTILECWTVFDISLDLFAYIILSRNQSQLMDELILIKLENLMRKMLCDKEKLRNLLRKNTDTSVKTLILEKLHESQLNINEQNFSNILSLLPYIKNDTILLKQLDLIEWSLTLQETYWQDVLSNGGLGFTDENLEQCAFYLVKLDSLYGNELVKNVINVIKEATLFSAKTLLIFVHRFYAEDMELCEDILDDFGVLNFRLSNLFEKPNKRYNGQELLELCQQKKDKITKDFSQIQDLMTKLGLSESNDRDIDRLVQMITKSHGDDNVFKHLSKIRDLLKRTADGENLVLKYIVDVINRNDQSNDTQNTRSNTLTCKICFNNENNLKRVINAIRSNIEEIKHIENCNYYILHIVNQGILLKRCFSLRDTQKLVVMLMLSNEKSLLSQVATGEGKTLIITTLCIIKCLYGEKLDIVTSCSVLAKRDAESEPPKGNKDLYELFDVNVGHICSQDIDQRAQTFSRCDVVYGDLSSFQRDYLLDRFYGKNILGKRNFENVIVDEVDSMLLDNGNNMLYLSHDIPNMEKLQSLFIFIWKSVNQPVNSLDGLHKIYDNSAIKQSIIEDIYGMIMRDEVDADVWQVLLKSKTIGEDGRILINFKDYTAHVKQFQFPKQKTENRLIFLLNIISNRQRFIKLPSEFYHFMEQHLDKFIDNAKNALFMNEGVDYVIDVDRTGLDPDLNPKIIIIDRNTGTDQSSSQWHEGLHQFLQIKHGCKLSLMSLKAVFISNVSYLKLYQNLYGLSGTLGSRDEKKLLNELYNIDLIKIPTSKPKNFFEERPVISGFKEQWTKNIYDETKKKIIKHRSVLIICETVKDVDYISKCLVKCAMEDLQHDPNNIIYASLKKPYIYKREHEEFTFGQGNELLNYGTVIIATNLAGRGTDIKLEQKLVKAGGLHVIVTFLPNNCRIEEQAYGRAARCGEHGSGQLIIIGNDEDGGSYSSKIFQLKNVRDVYELQRLKTIKKFYDERITIEEHCFKKFQQHYEELRQYLTTADDAKSIEKLLLDSFLDRWAFWLDENSQLIENQASHTSKKDQLFNHLNTFLTSISFDFKNWLNSPSQLLKLGNQHAKNKNYDEAEECFNRIIREYSYYLPEAHYYKSFVTIKRKTSALLKKSGQPFRQLKEDLLKAKKLFEERINDCSNDQAMVESFKKKEANSLIHIEAFSEQQKSLSQIYNLFIYSIDDILGHSLINNAFINFEINEILAYDICIQLQQQGILTRPKTTVPFSDEALIDVAMEYKISKSALENLRRELNNNKIIDSQSLIKVINFPNVEEFWSMLTDREVLTNETEFIIVNKQKLELIDNEGITHLIEQYKMKFEFEKLQRNELIQYPVGTCEEYIFCKLELYENLKKSDRIYLEDRCILSTNRKAKINPNEIKEKQSFDKFNSIILSDLTDATISEEDSIAILEILSRSDDGILEEIVEGKYELKGHINCSSLPECYQDVVPAILNSKFSYQLAYQHLQEQYNDIQENAKVDISSKLHLRLFAKPYEQLFYDLIDRGIIENVQVNYKKLKSIELKNIFEQPIHTYAKNHQKLSKKENIEFIKKTLEQLRCGIEKFETPDCFYSSLEGTLKAQQNLCIVEASWFSLNGLENLITLEEQRYSWKFWRNFAIVVVLGVSQIVAGAVLEIFTAGVGTYAASFLINEGISDLFFATGCLFNGYMTMSSYWEHKKWSMVMSAATCMIGGVLARGRTVSRIGYKVAGPVRAEGGKKIAQMVGKELIQNVGAKTIANETMKRVGCKLLEGVAFGAAQGAVDRIVTNYLNGVCDAIRNTITSDLDALYQQHPLNEAVSNAFETLGEDQARLLMKQVTHECFEGQSMLQTMYTWCKRIYGAVSRGIGEAMRKIGKTNSAKAVKTVLLVLKSLQIASLVEGVMTEIIKVKLSAGQFLDNATKIVQKAVGEKTSSKSTKTSAPSNVKTLCEETTQNWKQIFIETSNQAIANQIVAPILSFGANQLVSLAGDLIKKKYRSIKEEKYQKQFDSLKKDFDNKMNDEQMDSDEYEKELQAYHDTLMKVLAKTRNPTLFANIIRENVPMDMVCVQACTYVIHKYMSETNIIEDGKQFTGILIIVEGQDGSLHDYSSSSDPSHSIKIELDNNHFVVNEQRDGNTKTSRNNCLYKALVNKFPALKNAFADDAVFRQHLSSCIENDKFMHHTIAQGWHKLSIKKGSFGGAIAEEKFNQQTLYNQLLERTEEVKKNLIRKYPNLPDRVRQRFNQSIETIKKIAQDEGSNDRARQRINKITEDFSKYLTKELSGDQHHDLRTDFKKALSDFDNRVNQTLTTTYTSTLQNFQSKAELADISKNHPFSVHPADQVNFAQDDIRLKDLVGKSMKLSENTDIIASAVHAELNKALPEDVRRFNTVAACIHNKTLYIAMNQIETINGQQSYGISDERCTQIRDLLVSKNLVSGREEIVFLTPNTMPRNQAECRGPHAEMQIMKFLKDNGILQDNQIVDQNKPIRIGASKPACACCSTAMTTNRIHHNIYANANTNPVNWHDSKAINVKVQRKLRVRNYRI